MKCNEVASGALAVEKESLNAEAAACALAFIPPMFLILEESKRRARQASSPGTAMSPSPAPKEDSLSLTPLFQWLIMIFALLS